jgi:hypothetical protein
VPRLIQFSGVFKEASGSRVAAATVALYKDQEGGAPIWMETQNVRPDERGSYAVLLGATSPSDLPLDVFTSGKALWLGVQPQPPGPGTVPRPAGGGALRPEGRSG